VGIIAQEMKEIAPYTIGSFKDEETNIDYLNYDANAVTYILINAVQEQQLIIDATNKQLLEQNQKQLRIIDEMKKQLDEQNQRILRLEEKLK
jgi:3-deoxy-D-arabino-heptulosonate 7-phosphate (DAHP) synthase